MLPRPQNRQATIPVNARFAASRCVNLQEEPRDTRRLNFTNTSHLRSTFVIFPTYTFASRFLHPKKMLGSKVLGKEDSTAICSLWRRPGLWRL